MDVKFAGVTNQTDFDRVLQGDKLRQSYRNVMGMGKLIDKQIKQRGNMDSIHSQRDATDAAAKATMNNTRKFRANAQQIIGQ